MKKLLPFLIAITLLTSCDKQKSMGDSFLEDVRKGEVRFMQVPRGTMFYDPLWTKRITNRVNKDLKAQSWQYTDAEDNLEAYKILFNLPKDITGIEFIGQSEFTDTLSVVEPYSERYYKETDYLKSIYNTYQAFKDATLKEAKTKGLVETNDSLELIRYHEPVEAKTLKYRISTTNGAELVQIHLFHTKETVSGGEPWRIGAVTREDI